MFFVKDAIALLVAGGVGTLLRFLLSQWVDAKTDFSLPVATFTVNVTGCFLFGLFWAFMRYATGVPSSVNVVLLTGFVGAFTTFSTMTFEFLLLLKDSFFRGFLYLSVTQLLGVCFTALGIFCGKFCFIR